MTWWTHRKITGSLCGSCAKCWWRNIRCPTCNVCRWTSSTTTVAAKMPQRWRSSSERICLEVKSQDFTSRPSRAPIHRWCLRLGSQNLSAGVAALWSQIRASTSATVECTPSEMPPRSCMLHCHLKNIPKKWVVVSILLQLFSNPHCFVRLHSITRKTRVKWKSRRWLMSLNASSAFPSTPSS